MDTQLDQLKATLHHAGNLYIIKPGKVEGFYSVVDPLMPNFPLRAWENLSAEQLNDLVQMAAEELAMLKREWDAISAEKRATIAQACPWFAVYFGTIHRQ